MTTTHISGAPPSRLHPAAPGPGRRQCPGGDESAPPAGRKRRDFTCPARPAPPGARWSRKRRRWRRRGPAPASVPGPCGEMAVGRALAALLAALLAASAQLFPREGRDRGRDGLAPPTLGWVPPTLGWVPPTPGSVPSTPGSVPHHRHPGLSCPSLPAVPQGLPGPVGPARCAAEPGLALVGSIVGERLVTLPLSPCAAADLITISYLKVAGVVG